MYMFYIYFRFIGLSCESEIYLSVCICAQSFKCHSKVTSDFVFVGSSSLIATAGHSADNRNVCLWDTLLPQRRALVQGLIRTMLLCFTFVDIMMMFHVRNILCYNVKLSRCWDSTSCELLDATEVQNSTFLYTILVFFRRIQNQRVLQSGLASSCR